MDLRELQSKVSRWSQYNFPNNKPHMPLLGVGEEIGELVEADMALKGLSAAYGRLAHAHLKLEQGIRGTPELLRDKAADAVGDILIYLADYCSRNSIDMAGALELALHEVLSRDWVKFPGNGVDR
jgi:NTP pyrophosphatase (non-canonical NTP hydrolase)